MSTLRDQMRARFKEIAALRPGWFGPNDGEPVPQSALAFVRDWVENEDEEELARWNVYASPDGWVGFESAAGTGRHDTVRVSVDRIAYFVCADLRGWSAWIEVDREPPHALRELDAEAW